MTELPGTIIWRRRYDEAAHRESMRKFWMYYAAPVGIVTVLVAIFSGPGPAAGVLILMGMIGLLLFVWVWLTGRNERANPTVTLDGGNLRWGKRSVPVNQVTAFSTYMTSASTAMASPTGTARTVSANLGAARFLLVDGNEVRFVWVELDQPQLDELRVALEEVLPARWRPVDSLREPE